MDAACRNSWAQAEAISNQVEAYFDCCSGEPKFRIFRVSVACLSSSIVDFQSFSAYENMLIISSV